MCTGYKRHQQEAAGRATQLEGAFSSKKCGRMRGDLTQEPVTMGCGQSCGEECPDRQKHLRKEGRVGSSWQEKQMDKHTEF